MILRHSRQVRAGGRHRRIDARLVCFPTTGWLRPLKRDRLVLEFFGEQAEPMNRY
jgi:hypothetical protein